MKRAYFQYYETFEKVVQQFKTETARNKFRSKIIKYGLYGQEPDELDDHEAIAWVFVKDLIDDQVHRREVQAANRAKRNAPPVYTNGEPEEEEELLEEAAPDEKEPAKKTRKRAEPFVPPTPEEVDAYCKERKNGITGQAFCEYYQNKHRPWTVGNQKEPMRDWKAAVRQWESRRKETRKSTGMATDQVAAGAIFSCKKYE